MELDTKAPAVRLQQVSKTYLQGKTEVHAIRNISLTIPSGRFIAIMGTSGSGKSTLLHVIGGLTTPIAGTVQIFGQGLQDKSDRDLTLFRRQHIGLVFQSFNLLPTMNALQNVCLPRIIAGEKLQAIQSEAEKILQGIGLKDRMQHHPDELSGGQQQRVAIARALISKAPLLLADEPTGNLDSKTGEQILHLLKQLTKNGKRTIIMVTHDPKAAAYADQVITLNDGQVVEQLMTMPEAT